MKTYIRDFTKFTRLNEEFSPRAIAGATIAGTLRYFEMAHTQNAGAVGNFLMGKGDDMLGRADGKSTNIKDIMEIVKGSEYEKDFMEWLNVLNDMWRDELPDDLSITSLDKAAYDIPLHMKNLKAQFPKLYAILGATDSGDEEPTEEMIRKYREENPLSDEEKKEMENNADGEQDPQLTKDIDAWLEKNPG